MRLNPRLLKDTLTVERLTPAPTDPNTGFPVGEGRVVEVVRQMASDQDTNDRTRALAIVNGVPGSLPASICYTAWFPWPDEQGGEILCRVNGKHRPLMKQGPPMDVGGQARVYKLELAPPSGR